MLSPEEYMSRLAIPAMLTADDGSVIYQNPPVCHMISGHFRKRMVLSLGYPERGMIYEKRFPRDGRVVDLLMGDSTINALLIPDGGCLKWYFPTTLNGLPPISLPDICSLWIGKYAAKAERSVLSDGISDPVRLFSESAFSAFTDFRPVTRLKANDFCRFISLSSHYLFFRDRFVYSLNCRGIILQSPETAFDAAGEMFRHLLGKRNAVWRFCVENGDAFLTDGTTKLCAGTCSETRIPGAVKPEGTFSLLTAVMTASAVSSAEMAIFVKRKGQTAEA